jgi:hypothetical protein
MPEMPASYCQQQNHAMSGLRQYLVKEGHKNKWGGLDNGSLLPVQSGPRCSLGGIIRDNSDPGNDP